MGDSSQIYQCFLIIIIVLTLVCILFQILIGLRDENDAIVTATFHGLACIVPILGGKVVVGGERMKYFFDNRPNVSTFLINVYVKKCLKFIKWTPTWFMLAIMQNDVRFI